MVQFIQSIKPLEVADYDQLVTELVNKLSKIKACESIYQIGSVSSPGISDIDLLCVFTDGERVEINPREDLSELDQYMLVHSVFGTSRDLFEQAQQFTMFHNYVQLYGADAKTSLGTISDGEDDLKRQIALEYLLKFFVSLTVQQKHQIVKLRSLLLEVNALRYDLEFLGCTEGDLVDSVMAFHHIRTNWFTRPVSLREVETELNKLLTALNSFLDKELRNDGLLVPDIRKFTLGRNLTLERGDSVSVEHSGLVLPSIVGRFGPRLLNVQSRFNSFKFTVPMRQVIQGSLLDNRANYMSRAIDYNLKHLINFSPLISALQIYR